MKKTTLFSLLTMMLLSFSGNVLAEDALVKTDLTDLQTGDVIVIAETVNSYAMNNTNGTSAAPDGVKVEFSEDGTQITSSVTDALK